MYPNYINKPTFMSNTGNTSFGATTSSFGQPAANTPMFSSMQPSNIFQTPNTAATFNAGTSNQPTFGSNLFGQQQPQQPSTSGLFGGSNAFGQNKSTFGFGSTTNQTGLFGQPQAQPQAGSSLFQSNTSNLFGNTNTFGNQTPTGTVIKFSPVTGTDTMQKNGVTQSISTKHHCITCMKEYENKSLEELRFEDYSCNRKGPQQQTGFTSTPFSTGTAGNTTSLFGQADNKQTFGQTTGFGQTSTFGQNTTGFGLNNQTNTPSLFGKPTTFGTTTSNTTFGFNAAPSTANPFSASQATKPFSQQPLFGTATTQPQSAFGTGVFGQTNTQNTSTSLFQKPAQTTGGFNTGQPGFSFNQTTTTQAPNLFQTAKPTTGFGIFGQTNTSTTGFGQTSQPTFGTNFGKLTTNTFAQPTQQPSFGTTLGGGLQQQQPLFGNTAAKPANLFGSTTTGGSLFNNNIFQQPANSFSLNLNQQQPVQFPPEPTDDSKNLSLVATDSFPDGPHVYGLEPLLSDGHQTTTNPHDIKAMLDFSKKRDELLGTRSKIKVHLPKPKRGNNYSKEFFETNQALRASHKCLVIRKFNDSSSTIYNKYNNELLEEVEDCIKASNNGADGEPNSVNSPRSFLSEIISPEDKTDGNAEPTNNNSGKSRKIGLNLFNSSFSDTSNTEDTNASKGNFTFNDESAINPTPSAKGSLSKFYAVEEENNTVSESDVETPSNVSSSEMECVENPAGVILTRPEYYIYPALKDLHQYVDENGECVVRGLTIGRRGYGNIYFPDPIDIANMNLDEIVFFRHREVIVYPNDNKKPPVGEGLNRRAQVTLDKIYPREKGTNKYITDVNQIVNSNFVDNLMHVTLKHNCKFVDYRPKTGSWVFKVKHFSKYAFTDSDEEECELTADKMLVKKDLLNKVKEVEEFPKYGLGGDGEPVKKLQMVFDSEQLIDNDKVTDDLWAEEQEFMLSETLHYVDSSIQALKSTLFTNLEEAMPSENILTERSALKPKQELSSRIVLTPNVYKLPAIPMSVLHRNITTTQRCYTELGIFKNNTYKPGWSKGVNFFNFQIIADTEQTFALNHCRIENLKNGYYEEMMPDLEQLLKITLEESDFTFDKNNLPTLHIKDGTDYLKKQTKLFNNHVKCSNLVDKQRYLSAIWNLCSALWDKREEININRRKCLSDWLKQFTSDFCHEDYGFNESASNEQEAFKILFNLLTFYKIPEAYDFALNNNLCHLSLIISQLSANERIKYWLKNYLSCYAWKENENVMTEDFKKLYMLLAGIPVNAPLNVCKDMDWVRSFGIHLWYVAPAGASIETAFNLYKKAFQEYEYAVAPSPLYDSHFSNVTTANFDLIYHILTIFGDHSHQLCRLLNPETHTQNILDYRLSWFLLHLFLSLKIGLISESEQDHLHTSFANQLEDMGCWKWAIFSLLFLKNNVIKKNLITQILDRNLTDNLEIEDELVQVFKIPSEYIHQVKGTKCKALGQHYEYFQHCIYIKDAQNANNMLINYILPELFINEQHDYLMDFIRKLEPIQMALEKWDVEAGLFKDFVNIQEILYQNSDTNIHFLDSKLNSLFKRINSFPTNSDEQKLCVAELSRKCALLFKLLYKHIDNMVFLDQFVDILRNLVMPPDIKHYEIFFLISRYVHQPEITI